MREIVVAGHSMGAQMVQRYAAVGKELFLHGKPALVDYFRMSLTSYCSSRCLLDCEPEFIGMVSLRFLL